MAYPVVASRGFHGRGKPKKNESMLRGRGAIIGLILMNIVCLGIVVPIFFHLKVVTTTTDGLINNGKLLTPSPFHNVYSHGSNGLIVNNQQQQQQQNRNSDPSLLVFGTHVRIASGSTDAVYALPTTDSNNGNSRKMVGIALVLHACTHSAFKFFRPNGDCTDCVGLSEEIRITRTLLDKGYAVLAISSSDRKSGCWGGEKDIQMVKLALKEFQNIALARKGETMDHEVWNQIKNTVVSVGASSGGRFAAVLAAEGVATAGSLVMISNLGKGLRNKIIQRQDHPPIYLAPMPKDARTTKLAREDFIAMIETGSSLKNDVIFDNTTCLPRHVSPEFLVQRVPFVNASMSEMIVKALVGAGHLKVKSSSSGTDQRVFFVKDPTRSDWRDVLKRECGEKGCLQNQVLLPGLSPLAKAFHRAWGFHEYCSEVLVPALTFFEDRGKMYG